MTTSKLIASLVLLCTLTSASVGAMVQPTVAHAEGASKPYEIKTNGKVYACQDIGKLTVCAAK